MIPGLSAILGVSLQSVSAAIPVESLPQVFAAACLDGSATLSPGQAAEIAFEDLPNSLRKRLGTPIGGHVWKLASTGRAFLYSLEYKSGIDSSPKVCGLAAEKMEFGPASRMLEGRVDPNPLIHNSAGGREWVRPAEGYVATASAGAEFDVLQIRWLSPEQRKRLLFELKQMGAEVPKSTKKNEKP